MSDEKSQSRGCNSVADPESGVLADDSDAAPKMPEEFHKIVKDFIGDITNTFPEYAPIINKWWKPKAGDDIDAMEADTAAKLDAVFQHCLIVFPERFFDILYKNTDMFKKESEINTEFLPGISFKYLWQCDISDSTRETIWKYLQLILISIIGCVKNRDAFGDTAKLFQSINEDEFKGKLEETLENMQKMFEGTQNNGQDDSTDTGAKSGINMENMPSADDIQSHITGMLDGKLGNLAREIAEETAGNLDINMDNAKDVNDIFQNLFKNPGKLMGLVKNVGDKLDSRIKSGEIKESELLAEASEIMNKMKNMPGMGNIQSMLSKMGMNMPGAGVGADGADGAAAGLGRNVKVDTNATEALLNRNIKAAETRERLKKKMEMKHLAAALAAEQQKQQLQKQQQPNANTLTDEQLFSVFSTGDKVERTPRSAVNPNTATAIATATATAKSSTSDKKKKKNKK